MKASLESLANFIGFVVWADGEYDEAEKEAVVEIAETFGLNQLKFNIAVEVAINRILRMDEKEVNEFLHKAADDIDDVEIGQAGGHRRRRAHPRRSEQPSCHRRRTRYRHRHGLPSAVRHGKDRSRA